MTWHHPALSHAALKESDAEIVNLRAEIARLQEAKRRALKVADERAIEANGVRAENERLRAALAQCAAEYSTPPTTVMGAAAHVAAEIRRRMDIAGDALEQTPQAFVEAKAERDAGWPRDFEQTARKEKAE